MFSTPEDDRPYHMGVGSRIAGVVQGYRPQVDWGGDAGSATIVVGGHNVRVATSGWRKRCLYILLVALLALSIVNLSLTLLVLKTTYFNVDGMGELHITMGGMAMEGTTRFLGTVRTAQISSRKDKQLIMEGYHNLTLATVTTADNSTPTFLHVGVDGIVASSKGVEVKSTSGQPLFNANGKDGMTVGADRLKVTGSQGAILQGSLQTPQVFSRGVHELRLESATRSLSGRAAHDVSLEARDGDISIVSSDNLILRSKSGIFRFDNPKIYLAGLTEGGDGDGDDDGDDGVAATVTPAETQILPPQGRETSSTTPLPPPPSSSSSSSSSPSSVEVYQVCVCPNGRLFLMAAESTCEFSDNVCR